MTATRGGCGEKLKIWQLKASLGGGGSSSEVESIVESGRIFVRNLPFTTQEEALSDLFAKYGPLTEIILPLDKITNKATGGLWICDLYATRTCE